MAQVLFSNSSYLKQTNAYYGEEKVIRIVNLSEPYDTLKHLEMLLKNKVPLQKKIEAIFLNKDSTTGLKFAYIIFNLNSDAANAKHYLDGFNGFQIDLIGPSTSYKVYSKQGENLSINDNIIHQLSIDKSIHSPDRLTYYYARPANTVTASKIINSAARKSSASLNRISTDKPTHSSTSVTSNNKALSYTVTPSKYKYETACTSQYGKNNSSYTTPNVQRGSSSLTPYLRLTPCSYESKPSIATNTTKPNLCGASTSKISENIGASSTYRHTNVGFRAATLQNQKPNNSSCSVM